MTERIFLEKGNHPAESGKKCVNEFGAWVAGEEHSDMPRCFAPVAARFMMRLNDRLPDDLRQQLLPLAITMVGTNTGEADDEVRRWMLVDWAVHVAARYWFAEAGRQDWCARVDALPEVKNRKTAREAARVLREIRAAAAAAYAYAAAAAAAAYAAAAAAAYAYAAAAAYAYAAAAATRQRKAWLVLLPSALDLLNRIAAVGRKAEVELIEDRAAQIREACHV